MGSIATNSASSIRYKSRPTSCLTAPAVQWISTYQNPGAWIAVSCSGNFDCNNRKEEAQLTELSVRVAAPCLVDPCSQRSKSLMRAARPRYSPSDVSHTLLIRFPNRYVTVRKHVVNGGRLKAYLPALTNFRCQGVTCRR